MLENDAGMRECWKCYTVISKEFSFCTLCGSCTKIYKNRMKDTKEASNILDRTIGKDIDGTINKRTNTKERKESRIDFKQKNKVLSLNTNFLAALDRRLNSFCTEEFKKYKQFTEKSIKVTAFLEYENARRVEEMYEDTSLNTMCAAIPPSSVFPPVANYITYTNETLKDYKPENDSIRGSYLNEVPPISMYYKRFLNRENELKGLTSASVDTLVADDSNIVAHPGAWWFGDSQMNASGAAENYLTKEQHESKYIAALWTHMLPISDLNPIIKEHIEDAQMRHNRHIQTEHKQDVVFSTPENDELSVDSASDSVTPRALSFTLDSTFTVSSSIARMYRESCIAMEQACNSSNLNLVIDPIVHKSASLLYCSQVIGDLKKSLLFAEANDKLARLEYEIFLKVCNQRRAEAATKVTEALKSASIIYAHYNSLILAVILESKNEQDDAETPKGATAGWINVKIDRIKAKAEKDMEQKGNLIRRLQGDEADLVVKLKEDEFVMIKIIKKWRLLHGNLTTMTRKAVGRVRGLLRETAARLIQRNARQKLLVYHRLQVFQTWNIEIQRRLDRHKNLKDRKDAAISEYAIFAAKRNPISESLILPKLTGRRFQKERSALTIKSR